MDKNQMPNEEEPKEQADNLFSHFYSDITGSDIFSDEHSIKFTVTPEKAGQRTPY